MSSGECLCAHMFGFVWGREFVTCHILLYCTGLVSLGHHLGCMLKRGYGSSVLHRLRLVCKFMIFVNESGWPCFVFVHVSIPRQRVC